MSIGGPEMIVILIVALLVFGSRLPMVMRNLGKSVNEFKRGLNETLQDESESAA
ncbi:MAG: twin-arginine translocase TatA/TatE family subunit [Planctomycetota bacterium]